MPLSQDYHSNFPRSKCFICGAPLQWLRIPVYAPVVMAEPLVPYGPLTPNETEVMVHGEEELLCFLPRTNIHHRMASAIHALEDRHEASLS